MFQTSDKNTGSAAKNENKSFSFFKPFIQPKLSVNQPNDVYEQEADAIADKVMRMQKSSSREPFFAASPIQRQCTPCKEEKQTQLKEDTTIVQRDDTTGSALPFPDLTLKLPPLQPIVPKPSLALPALAQPDLSPTVAQPDFLAMRQPFFNRNIFHLWDTGSALHVWQYNFDFFHRFGLAPGLSASLSNFTTPMFIDAQLKTGNPTWWEITDRELNTSTLAASVPLLDFNADFSPTAPSWFKSLFGGGGSPVQRKEDDNQLQRKEKDGESAVESSAENYIRSLSGGMPLNENQRSFYEPEMGYDFSSVRLHTDSFADKSANELNALAYTSGNDIVFKAGQYQPETDNGKRLMAHELTHVVQQKDGGSIMRTPNPRPAAPAALTDYSEANRQRITYDTSIVALNPAPYFQTGLVDTPRAGYDIDYVFTGAIAAWLQTPLRRIARAIFALQSIDTDPVIINALLIKALDLTPFHENRDPALPAGPNTRFRFTCRQFDATTATVAGARQTTQNLQIFIEDIGMPQTIPHSAENAAQRIARFFTDYGFSRVDDTFFNDADFNRVLMAVSLVPDSVLRSIRDIPFNRVVGQALGPTGEAAEYSWRLNNGAYTRVINIYDDALRSSVSAQSLAFLMTHEIGHAIAHRPAEATGAAAQTDLSAETGRGSFRAAATADGGLSRAITTYGSTGWGEYFAEAYTTFINEPDILRTLRPHVYTYFTTRFPAPAPAAAAQAPAAAPAP